MTISIPMFTQDQPYQAWMMRRQMSSLLLAPGVPQPGTDLAVSTTGTMQVRVSAGSAWVPQTIESQEPASTDEGVYYVYNDAPASPYNTVSPPVTNPRVDQVILRVYDVVEQVLSGSSYARFEWVPGSEAVGAQVSNPGGAGYLAGAASLPDNSLRLAYVLQTVGETSVASGNIATAAPAAQSALRQQFGPWVPLTLHAGIITAPASEYVPSMRFEGDTVRLKGCLQNTSGATVTAGTTLATLPAGSAPSASGGLGFVVFGNGPSGFPLPSVSSNPYLLVVNSGGVIFCVSDLLNDDAVLLDGISYTLS